MILSMLLAATKPWTYWVAPPLLVVTVLAIVSFGAVYYRKVVEPRYQLMLHERRANVAQLHGPTSLAPRVPAERPRAQAA